MPLHDFRCALGHTFEARVPAGTERLDCSECADGRVAEKVFLRFPLSHVQQDICYDSPVDGRPITTKQARLNDLARNNCVEWDPGMRQDFERRREAEERAFDASVERTIDAEIAALPAVKRERLDAEAAEASINYDRKGVANVPS